jgi:tRNA threonylcarbamoyladenosine biosynthesis protein TsaE
MTPRARRTTSVEETERLGEGLAPALAVGDIVALSGPLGAGKTRFVAGLARGLAAAARVRSPTYTLVNEYPGRILLAHLDLYRLAPAELEGLGLVDHLERAALVVEWGEKLPGALRDEALELTFEIVSEGARAITARAIDGRGLELLAAWEAAHGAAKGAAPRHAPAPPPVTPAPITPAPSPVAPGPAAPATRGRRNG